MDSTGGGATYGEVMPEGIVKLVQKLKLGPDCVFVGEQALTSGKGRGSLLLRSRAFLDSPPTSAALLSHPPTLFAPQTWDRASAASWSRSRSPAPCSAPSVSSSPAAVWSRQSMSSAGCARGTGSSSSRSR